MTILPLRIGRTQYAVRLDRVATVLRTGVLDDVSDGDVVELDDHTIELADSGEIFGESLEDPDAVVVYHGRGSNGHVPGWLVSDVGDPASVDEVRPTVGSIRHVRGKVDVDGDEIVLVDPLKIHRE